MGSAKDSFPDLLDALSGRADLPSDADPAILRSAEILLERGRAVAAEPSVPRSWIRRARRIARARPALFALVFDSWLEPRPALRGAATAPRFLRFEGPATVDLELGAKRTLLGQLEPADAAPEVQLEVAGKVRRARVAPDGTFRFARVPSGEATLTIGDWKLEDLPL
ncbi:MAG: hypothetical protein ACYTHK_09935 [Planctomycetota bacterium]|jgi:hypothetical protein